MSADAAKNAATVRKATTGNSGILGDDGKVPTHTHEDANGIRWECDSPYCIVLKGLPHPDDGGPKPIVVGQEPWRR